MWNLGELNYLSLSVSVNGDDNTSQVFYSVNEMKIMIITANIADASFIKGINKYWSSLLFQPQVVPICKMG